MGTKRIFEATEYKNMRELIEASAENLEIELLLLSKNKMVKK